MNKCPRDRGKLNYKHYACAVIVVGFMLWIIGYSYFDIHQGFLGALNKSISFIFLFIPFCFLIFFGYLRILKYIYFNEGKIEFLKYLFIAILMYPALIFGIFYGIKSVYDIILDEKIVVSVNDYELNKEKTFYRGDNYVYYLKFNKSEMVRINPTTYHKLYGNDKYHLIITYKPKAEILYDLQISSK